MKKAGNRFGFGEAPAPPSTKLSWLPIFIKILVMNITALEPIGLDKKGLENLGKRFVGAGHRFTPFFERVEDTPSLIARAKDADAVLVSNIPLSREFVEACPSLKMISTAFTGYDHIDATACRERGIVVSNAAGYAVAAVAELAVALMIALLRKIPSLDPEVRSGGTRSGFLGTELSGKTAGIVGTGEIGRDIARLLLAFGCRVLGHDRVPCGVEGVHSVPLEELLRNSDIVSIHVPLTPDTKRMIGKKELAMMKPSAVLINTARGAVVDNEALAAALREGRIAGAGIDVFDMEPPLPAEYPLLRAPNTILTPHIGYATREAIVKRAEIAAANITAWLGGKPINRVI
jgi:phosphoglycerate dehydrogenase-like enzyme